jgi:VWFA-related protein
MGVSRIVPIIMKLKFMAAFAGCMALAVLVAPAQDPGSVQGGQAGPPGTIRVRVRLIPVDVIVTDQNNNPVTDLKPEDFEIFEDGRAQEVRHFSVQTFSADAPAPALSVVPATNPALELTPQSSRTFLIMMGRGRHQTPLKAIDALLRFVRNDLLPQDRVAVFAYNRATDFTTDHERIAQVLERYKKSNEKIESWLESRFRGLTTVYGMKEIPKSFQSEIDKIFDSGDMLASRQVPPGRITEIGTIVRDWDRAAVTIAKDSDRAAEIEVRTDVAEEVAEEDLPGSQVMLSLIKFDTLEGEFLMLGLEFDEFSARSAGSFQDLQNLYTCIEYLRYMQGQKHLLYFTDEGLLFPGGNVSHDNGIMSIANDARVAIDVFQTGGLFADPEIVPTKGTVIETPPARSNQPPVVEPPQLSQRNWSRGFMLSSLSNVAKLTGGRTAIGTDISRALNRLDDSTRVQYLLGYYPRNDRWDGEYRRIQVKVKRPGTRVFYRQGYFARDSLRPYNREEFLAYSRISAAGAFEFNVEDIPFQVDTIKTLASGDSPQVRVDLQVDADAVDFKLVGNRHVARLYVAVFYGKGDDDYLGSRWQTVNLELPEASYQRMLRTGIQVTSMIPLEVSKQVLKVIIYDTWGDKIGSKLVKLR